jgi:GT2 family glycosyltransferase
MELPRVVAVVLNWCGESVTAACLRSLRASDYPALEVLLVDSASPDGSGAALHAAFPELPYLQTPTNLGYAGGNNRGIEWALERACDYVLIVNNDTELAPDAVRELVGAARAEARVGAVAPKILYHAAPERIWFAGGEFRRARALGVHCGEGEMDRERLAPPREVSFLTGCCLLLPAPVLRAVGGFQEDFFAYVEDVELSLRLQEAGYRLLYAPSARILHHVPLDAGPPSPFQIYHRDRNRRRMVRRRYGTFDRLRFGAFFYPTRICHAVRYLARRDLPRARAIWQGMTER